MTKMLTVTANATLAVPDGFAIHPDYPERLVAPDGEVYKFWVAVELFQGPGGSDVEEHDMDSGELSARDMHIEHDGSILTLASDAEPLENEGRGLLTPTELPGATLVTDPHAVDFGAPSGEETAQQVYDRTGDERLRTVM